MGYGDDIMATAIAKQVVASMGGEGTRACFGNPDTYHDPGNNALRVHWSEVFENNPYVVQPGEPINNVVCVPDYPGHRVSIDYERCKVVGDQITQFAWLAGFRAPVGELHFTNNEKSEASEIALRLPFPFYVVEPLVADKPWTNSKGWPFGCWQDTIHATPEIAWVQLGDGERVLDGVHHVLTPSFRQACAILSTSAGFVGTDGGLHHAAAALGIPAVVLWSHYTSPEVFGYEWHTNIRTAEGPGCGILTDECESCKSCMLDITTQTVVQAIEEMCHDERHRSDQTGGQGSGRPVFRLVGETAQGGQG